MCDTNDVHEGAALWKLQFLVKRPDAGALEAHMALRSKWHRRQEEGTVMTYCESVNFLLDTYATDEVIVETADDMMHFTEPSDRSPMEYAEAL